MYIPNVIIGALDAIGPEPHASSGIQAYHIWEDARLNAVSVITQIEHTEPGWVFVPGYYEGVLRSAGRPLGHLRRATKSKRTRRQATPARH